MVVGVFALAYFWGGKDGAGEANVISFIGSSAQGGVSVGESPSAGEATNTASPAFALTKEYKNSKYAFSFNHPEDYSVSFAEDDAEGDTLVLQNARGEGFQIIMRQTDENIKTISAEMIRRDIPDIVMENTQDVILGSSGRGVAFMSDNPIFGGQSREVWFARNKVFYQLSANVAKDALIQAVLSSWKFEGGR